MFITRAYPLSDPLFFGGKLNHTITPLCILTTDRQSSLPAKGRKEVSYLVNSLILREKISSISYDETDLMDAVLRLCLVGLGDMLTNITAWKPADVLDCRLKSLAAGYVTAQNHSIHPSIHPSAYNFSFSFLYTYTLCRLFVSASLRPRIFVRYSVQIQARSVRSVFTEE